MLASGLKAKSVGDYLIGELLGEGATGKLVFC